MENQQNCNNQSFDDREGTIFSSLWKSDENIKGMKRYFNIEIIWGIFTLIPFLALALFPITLILWICLGVMQRGYKYFPNPKTYNDKKMVRVFGWCTLIPFIGWIFSILLIIFSVISKGHFNECLMKEQFGDF